MTSVNYLFVFLLFIAIKTIQSQSISDVTIQTGLSMFHISDIGLSPKIGAGI